MSLSEWSGAGGPSSFRSTRDADLRVKNGVLVFARDVDRGVEVFVRAEAASSAVPSEGQGLAWFDLQGSPGPVVLVLSKVHAWLVAVGATPRPRTRSSVPTAADGRVSRWTAGLSRGGSSAHWGLRPRPARKSFGPKPGLTTLSTRRSPIDSGVRRRILALNRAIVGTFTGIFSLGPKCGNRSSFPPSTTSVHNVHPKQGSSTFLS